MEWNDITGAGNQPIFYRPILENVYSRTFLFAIFGSNEFYKEKITIIKYPPTSYYILKPTIN